MSDYPMLISNKLHSFRNFSGQIYKKELIRQGFHTKKILNGILLFPITSLIIHNYKYIYYKSIYNFCNFAPSLIKN